MSVGYCRYRLQICSVSQHALRSQRHMFSDSQVLCFSAIFSLAEMRNSKRAGEYCEKRCDPLPPYTLIEAPEGPSFPAGTKCTCVSLLHTKPTYCLCHPGLEQIYTLELATPPPAVSRLVYKHI